MVYDQTMFESLCNSLKYFIKTNTTEVLLFCTLRNHNTYKEFLYTLGKKPLLIFIFQIKAIMLFIKQREDIDSV